MPDPGKLQALEDGAYQIRPSCESCVHFTPRFGAWGRCTKIEHEHGKHGHQEGTGVLRSGYCPSYDLVQWYWQELQRAGYDRFLTHDAFNYSRASGDVECGRCGKLYRDHERDGPPAWPDGRPILRRLCDGKLVKI